MAQMSTDPKSTYYDAGGIETMDIIRAKLTPEQFKGFLLGNSLKYLCRVNFKHSGWEQKRRDFEKAKFYADVCAIEFMGDDDEQDD